MPHILLEYSDNVNVQPFKQGLFKKIHRILNTETGIRLENCKSRSVKYHDYYIANGDPEHAFINLDVGFLEGRSDEVKNRTGKALLNLLKTFITENPSDLEIQITVEIRDIPRKTYFKHPDNL